MPAATTPCPRCGAALRVEGERGTCRACGQAVRFVDAPEVACASCGGAVPILPGRHAARCGGCGTWNADDPERPVRGRARCPRCRRTIDVPLEGERTTCPFCASALALQDTL